MTAETPVAEPTAPQSAEDARAARRAKRWYQDNDTAPDYLRSSGVPHEHWPSRAQYTRWSPFLLEGMGADDLGWWYAKCPLHDPGMDGELSAMIHFKHGMLRCTREVDDDHPCHPGKTGITLSNVVGAMLSRLQQIDGEDDGGTAAESV
jgi:hypothetical protein